MLTVRKAGYPPGGYRSSKPKKGSVKIKGFRSVNRANPAVKYGPLLSDLRIKGFVEETQRITAKAKKGKMNWSAVLAERSNTVLIDELDEEIDGHLDPKPADFACMDVDGVHKEQVDNDSAAQDMFATQMEEDEQGRGQNEGQKDQGTAAGSLSSGLPTTANISSGMNQPLVQNNKNGDTVGNSENVWQKHKGSGLSFADQIKINQADQKVKLEYIPPVITPEGKCRVVLTKEDLLVSAKAFPLYLYGYFLGTSMDFQKVNLCLKRLWKAYDIAEISKSTSWFYYFKFSSESGLTSVLENGPWLVNNVPIILNRWAPGICLDRIEPCSIPIWVTVHNVPMELWTDRGMSIIFSGVGKPMLLDRVTQARVVNKTGKLGYARMLVNAKVELNLPSEVEVEYPSENKGEVHIGKLNISCQWKPAVCKHCKVFGHSFMLCKKRPKTDEELAAQPKNEVPVKASNNQNSAGIEVTNSASKNKNNMHLNKGKGLMKTGNNAGRVEAAQPSEKTVTRPKNIHKTNDKSKPSSSGVKKGGGGFNFARAVQGATSPKGKPKSGPLNADKQSPVAVHNSFAVLDMEASCKASNLVAEPVDKLPTARSIRTPSRALRIGKILLTQVEFSLIGVGLTRRRI
ncbi:putative transcription factor interactor and regulator CCHC(Zn) family [Helianthus annuus]|nr:putative transcription factor interactor and regulator CCHC(Zn) family [Helianthus annuus]